MAKSKKSQATVTIPREDWQLLTAFVKLLLKTGEGMARGDASGLQAMMSWGARERTVRLKEIVKMPLPKRPRGHHAVRLVTK